MDLEYNLFSVQPIMKSNDPVEQWQHYQSLIKSQLKNLKLESNVSFLVLPEYALGNKTAFDESKIEKLESRIQNFATEQNIHIIAGSHAHLENNKWYNRAILFEANSNHRYMYDKKHLFNFELKNDITPGSLSGIFIIDGLKVKIMICSDLWFPEEIRNNLQENIDVIIVPAMAVVQNQRFVGYGKTLWHSLAQTRSKENVIPLIVSDWAEQPIRESYTCGSSCIVDPSIRWQTELEAKNSFRTFDKINEGIIWSTISHKRIKEYQKYRTEVGLLPENL